MAELVPMRAGQMVPPVNYEAEQALLGAIIANNEVFPIVDTFLRPEHFADPLHGRVYACCAHLIGEGRIADIMMLKRMMDADLALQGVPAYRERGGSAYIIDLARAVVSITAAPDYAHEIVECYIRRRVLDVCQMYMAEVTIPDLATSAGKIIEGLESHLAKISDELTTQQSVVGAAEVSAGAVALMERAMRSPGHIVGLSTGIGDLDFRLGGIRPSLIILGGRPSMGKTTLALNVMRRNAIPDEEGLCGVYLASQEMDRDQIGQKFLALESGIGTDRQSRGGLSEDEVSAIMAAHDRVSHMEFEVDDASGQTVAGIQSRARRYQRRLKARGGKLTMVIIDYLQLMRGNLGSRSDNRVQELSEITRGLQQMRKNLGVPILALSQLSRKLEEREDKRPQLADLRESGSIEQDADVVMFVYRDEYYLTREEPKRGSSKSSDAYHEKLNNWTAALEYARNVSEIIIAKNRMGKAPMVVETYFNAEAGMFTNLRRQEIS